MMPNSSRQDPGRRSMWMALSYRWRWRRTINPMIPLKEQKVKPGTYYSTKRNLAHRLSSRRWRTLFDSIVSWMLWPSQEQCSFSSKCLSTHSLPSSTTSVADQQASPRTMVCRCMKTIACDYLYHIPIFDLMLELIDFVIWKLPQRSAHPWRLCLIRKMDTMYNDQELWIEDGIHVYVHYFNQVGNGLWNTWVLPTRTWRTSSRKSGPPPAHVV